MLHKDLNQILCAALINENFREKLLGDPLATIATGYEGFSFSLSLEEQQMINSIQANNLEDFAAQVYAGLHPKRLGIMVDMPGRKAEALPVVGLRFRVPDEALVNNSYAD